MQLKISINPLFSSKIIAMPLLSIIIPCYFNAENLPSTFQELFDNEKNFPQNTDFEYVMIDDGSKDATYTVLYGYYLRFPKKIKIIKLAKNVGAYNALAAGFRYATGDCCVVITADLQDPPALIPQLFAHWQNGYKLVIANREDRQDRRHDRLFATIFHRLIRRFGLQNLPKGGYDFVLFDAVLRDAVVQINEKNTNILYLMLWLGYDYVTVPYTRQKRKIGQSRWTFAKKLKLFIDSFVSFSYAPIRFISAMGLILGLLAVVYALFLIVNKLFGFIQVSGWTTMMVVMVLLGGFQMTALGVIGEYVWRILDESRRRPSFVVEKEHL